MKNVAIKQQGNLGQRISKEVAISEMEEVRRKARSPSQLRRWGEVRGRVPTSMFQEKEKKEGKAQCLKQWD